MMRAYGTLMAALFVLAAFGPLRTDAAEMISVKGQTVYVSIYSHVYSGDREHPYYLAATLSIRNTDLTRPITVLSADYYDSDGKLLQKYLDRPQRLDPLASIRYVVKESDKAGGSGAKFIVKWKAETAVNEPIIEGVMIGTKMQQGISFITQGVVVEEVK